MILILMVCMLIRPGQLLCPVSDLTSTKTTMYTYSGFTSSGINKIIAGPVSNNLYYFDGIGSPSQAVIRKIGLDGTTYWYASISGSSCLKSAAIDRLEQRAYIAIYAVPLEIVQFSTNDGSITGAAQFSNISGDTPAVQIHVLSDNSGYYFSTKLTSTSKLNVCRYLFASPSTSSCQEAPTTLETYCYTQLLLSDSQIFFIAVDVGAPYTEHMYKLTFGNTSPDWASKILCPFVLCVDSRGVAKLSNDGSLLYVFFNYGAPICLFFITLDASTGSSIGSLYKSNYQSLFADGFTYFGDYIIVIVKCNSIYTLLMYNTISSSFILKDILNSPNIYSVLVEPIYERIIINGKRSNICYETKVYFQSIEMHPDLSSSTLVMSALSPGSFDVVLILK